MKADNVSQKYAAGLGEFLVYIYCDDNDFFVKEIEDKFSHLEQSSCGPLIASRFIAHKKILYVHKHFK